MHSALARCTAAGIAEADHKGFYEVPDTSDGVKNAVENARRVMGFAKDMLRCSREVGSGNINCEPHSAVPENIIKRQMNTRWWSSLKWNQNKQ